MADNHVQVFIEPKEEMEVNVNGDDLYAYSVIKFKPTFDLFVRGGAQELIDFGNKIVAAGIEAQRKKLSAMLARDTMEAIEKLDAEVLADESRKVDGESTTPTNPPKMDDLVVDAAMHDAMIQQHESE